MVVKASTQQLQATDICYIAYNDMYAPVEYVAQTDPTYLYDNHPRVVEEFYPEEYKYFDDLKKYGSVEVVEKIYEARGWLADFISFDRLLRIAYSGFSSTNIVDGVSYYTTLMSEHYIHRMICDGRFHGSRRYIPRTIKI